MYSNTGRGGAFFDNMYDWFDLSEIRKVPATKEEFLKAGLSESDFNKYLAYVMRLYAEYFVDAHGINQKYRLSYPDVDALWTEFIDFCIDHNLVLEFADSNGNRMPTTPPHELSWFKFIYHYPECQDTIHICTLDEFRLAVEMNLANKDPDWYLDLRYEVRIVAEDFDEYLMRYDLEQETMVLLTKQEVHALQLSIQADIRSVQKKIAAQCADAPRIIIEGKTIGQEYFDILKEQQQWIGHRIELEQEFNVLSETYDAVSTVVDSGVHEEVYQSFPDDTLYIHKGRIVCEKNNHHIEQATAILRNRDGADIKLNVSHCLECKKFFLHYNIYQHYREKYGTILGNIRMTKNGDFSDDGYDLADESPLRLCGYSVSQKAGLSQGERQTIISSCIESGAMTKASLIHLLNWFVEVNGAKKGNELALKKWYEDLDYTLAYNTARQKHYQITKIARYGRNRFLVGAQQSNANRNGKIGENLNRSILGKRVKHKKYGYGQVGYEDNSIIEVAFDDGKTVRFTTKVVRDGFIELI